ncbi:MAG: ankyrin repeat domain-containing protein [Cellulomonas sp.]
MDRWVGILSGMDREVRQQLHYRALEGDVPGLRERLAAGDDIGLVDKQGVAALHFAAQQSQTEAVGVLLDAGAPIDPQDRFGNTPLWRAVFDARGRGATVQLLLKAGADPDIRNEAGATPRDLADRIGSESVVALFNETH